MKTALKAGKQKGAPGPRRPHPGPADRLRRLLEPLRRAVLRRLEAPRKRYTRHTYNNMKSLGRQIRKGDVLLVEGRSEMGRIIGLFSHSPWTHVAFYVGDALIQPGRPHRDRFIEAYGKEAGQLLVEAYVGEGVTAVPLSKYRDYNMRVCRPFGIEPGDLEVVVEEITANIGKRYDSQNIVDIALMLLPLPFGPFRRLSIKSCLGRCDDFTVICSGMIAKAFQKVGYPVMPGFAAEAPDRSRFHENPYGAALIMRHYSQILPRDFDLSPNFEVIKYNLVTAGRFDYKSLWAESPFAAQGPRTAGQPVFSASPTGDAGR